MQHNKKVSEVQSINALCLCTEPRSQDEFSTLTRTQARTWTRTRIAIVYSTRAPYENRLIKIYHNWLEMKLSNFYLCFHALDINALLLGIGLDEF
jgi:hypothetical protein